jgi:hypothetical protein
MPARAAIIRGARQIQTSGTTQKLKQTRHCQERLQGPAVPRPTGPLMAVLAGKSGHPFFEIIYSLLHRQ